MRHNKKLILIIFLLFTISFVGISSKSNQDTNWKYPGFDKYRNNFFHQQSEINLDNAKDLEVKWVWEIPRRDIPIFTKSDLLVRGSWTPPLVIDGIIYTATFDNQFFALSSEDGREICRYQVPRESIDRRSWYSQRGITYYNGSILMTAADCSIYAFNIKDCSVDWILPSTCENIPGNLGNYMGMNPPFIYKDYLIVVNGASELGARGFVAAYNVSTNELLWRWFTIPPAVEGPKNWHLEAHKGNIEPFENDWGNSTDFGGGSVWTWPAVDEEDGILFFGTGNPSPDMNASSRPGPNLFTDSVVALNITNGELIWYYQITSHDLYDHDIGFSVIFDEAIINDKRENVVIAGSKSGHVIVLKAEDGKPLYDPIPLSIQLNNINDNNPNADLTLEGHSRKVVCPAKNGGIQSSLGFADNTIFAVSQNQCNIFVTEEIKGRGDYAGGFIEVINSDENSTLYAIDVSNGDIKWEYFMNSTYRKGAATISGDLVLVGDDDGFVHILNKNNGELLNQFQVEAPIGAAITLGADLNSEMRIYVPFGSRGIRGRENGIMVLGLKENEKNYSIYVTLIIILLILLLFLLSKNRKKSITDYFH